jgi:hypothetical protein
MSVRGMRGIVRNHMKVRPALEFALRHAYASRVKFLIREPTTGEQAAREFGKCRK